MTILLIGMSAIFIGSLLQSTIGFGFSLIAVPSLLLILPKETVVPLIVLLSIVLNFFALLESYKKIEIKTILWLVLGGGIGIPIGTIVLTRVDEELFKFSVGCFIILFILILKMGWSINHSKLNKQFIPIGLFSGILNGSIAVPGPPVILFFAQAGTPKEIFRSNLLGYFWILHVITLVYFIYSGLITQKILLDTSIYTPILIIGTFIGVKLTKRVSESLFKNLTFVVVGMMGFVLIISNIP